MSGKHRIHMLGGLLAAAVILAPATPGPVLPPGCPCDVEPYSTMIVVHRPTGPGGQQIPWVDAATHLYVRTGRVPRTGTVTIWLQYRHYVISRWQNVEKIVFGNPWHAGWTHLKYEEHVCIYPHSWWRLHHVYDFRRANGQLASGYYNWPSNLGRRMTCLVIAGPRR